MAGQLASQPQGYQTLQVGRVTVLAPAALANLAVVLGEHADRPVTWPGLTAPDSLPLRLVLAPDEPAFARINGGRLPDWGIGLALPSARTIVVRADAPDPITALRHELAHLALHAATRGRVRLPLWFLEGYAVVAAGEWDRLEALRLNLAVVQGRVGDLATLDAALRRSPAEAATAYALAGAAVLYLTRRTPTASLEPLLTRLAAGEPFEPAVLTTTGLTVGRFEVAWQRDLRRRYGVLTWLVAGGGWALLGVGVIGLAFWRRRRDETRRAQLDEGWVLPDESEASPSDDSLDRGPSHG